MGALLGVRRSNGRVTVARVDPPLASTQPGFVHVTVDVNGSCKDVTLGDLFALPQISAQVLTPYSTDNSSYYSSMSVNDIVLICDL